MNGDGLYGFGTPRTSPAPKAASMVGRYGRLFFGYQGDYDEVACESGSCIGATVVTGVGGIG